MQIVWGSQGAAMFPMPLIAGGFELPPNPQDYTDERIPTLALTIDIDGFDDGTGGHFKRIANFPVTFEILPDGSYQFLYVPVIVPDTLPDPQVLDGHVAHLAVELEPFDAPTLSQVYDLVVSVAARPF